MVSIQLPPSPILYLTLNATTAPVKPRVQEIVARLVVLRPSSICWKSMSKPVGGSGAGP